MKRVARGLRRWLSRRRELAQGTRKVEVGSGFSPRDGYLHIDLDPGAPHLEYVAEARELPLPDGFADELLASHVLEHVEPRFLQSTLREWHRVLKPGGTVEIHSPDSAHLMRHWLEAERG